MPLPDVGLRAVIDNMGGFMSSANKVDQAMGRLGGSAEKSAGRMGTLGKVATQAMGTAMGIVGYKAVGALTGAMAESISVAGDFQSQMNILGVAARSSGTAINELREASIAVGADTELVGISAAEAADALTNFYKAGLETGDIFEDLEGYLKEGVSLTGALRSAVDLAAASELNLGQASEVVAISMATFGLEAKDAARIADSFVGAADASIAEVEDLTAALAGFGPTAAQFGWSLEETNQALAVLSTRGIAGSEAGTALRAMMTNLNRDVDDVVETLQDLNVELYDSEGDMYSLRNIVEQLSGAMGGLTEEQQNAAIQTLAGTYGMKAMATLLEEGTEGWDAMGAAINEAATAQEVAAARTKGWNAAMEQFHGAIETLMIKVGTPLIEKFLTPAIQKITDFISLLVMGGPTIARWADWLKKVGSVLATVLFPVVALTKVLTTLVGIDDPLGSMRGLAGGIWSTLFPEGLPALLSKIGDGLERFMGIFSDLGQYIEAVVEDGDYLNDWLTHLPGLIQKPVEMFGRLLSILQDLGRYIGAVLGDGDYLNDWLTHLPGPIQGAAEAFGKFLSVAGEALSRMGGRIKTAVEGVMASDPLGTLRTWWEEHQGELWTTAETAWEKISNVYGFGDTDVLGTIQAKLEPVATWWKQHNEGLRETARQTWEVGIAGRITSAGATIGKTIDELNIKFPELESVVVAVGTVFAGAILYKFLGPVGLLFSAVRIGKAGWDENWFGLRDTVTEVAATYGIDLDEMKTKLKELWDRAVEAVAGIKTAFKELELSALSLTLGTMAAFLGIREDVAELEMKALSLSLRAGAAFLELKGKVEGLAEAWSTGFGRMVELYRPFLDLGADIRKLGVEIFAVWLRKDFLPALIDLGQKLSDLWTDALKPSIDGVRDAISDLLEGSPMLTKLLGVLVELVPQVGFVVAKLAGKGFLLFLEGSLRSVSGAIEGLTIWLRIVTPLVRGFGLVIEGAIRSVDGLTSAVNWMWSRLQQAWAWVASHTFRINVQWPSVPSWLSWLVPGSLPPIAEGVQAINLELTRTVDILGRLGAGVTAPYVSAPAGAALLQSGPQVTHQWAPVVNANYVDTQSPIAISDDLEALAIAMRMMS